MELFSYQFENIGAIKEITFINSQYGILFVTTDNDEIYKIRVKAEYNDDLN
jgi:hypothetical protein